MIRYFLDFCMIGKTYLVCLLFSIDVMKYENLSSILASIKKNLLFYLTQVSTTTAASILKKVFHRPFFHSIVVGFNSPSLSWLLFVLIPTSN